MAKSGEYQQASTLRYDGLYCNMYENFCELSFSRDLNDEPQIETGNEYYVALLSIYMPEKVPKTDMRSKWMPITLG